MSTPPIREAWEQGHEHERRECEKGNTYRDRTRTRRGEACTRRFSRTMHLVDHVQIRCSRLHNRIDPIGEVVNDQSIRPKNNGELEGGRPKNLKVQHWGADNQSRVCTSGCMSAPMPCAGPPNTPVESEDLAVNRRRKRAETEKARRAATKLRPEVFEVIYGRPALHISSDASSWLCWSRRHLR